MKTKLLLTALLSFIFCLLSSQVPQGFNYQAVARDGLEHPITGLIDVKIAILTDDDPETVLWEELHADVDPDDHGMFSIVVGKGVTQPGGLASFSLIDWTLPALYIRTKIDDVELFPVTRLYSVPYTMVAEDLVQPVKKLEVKGETASETEPLFEVKNSLGKSVFAVYDDGVSIHVAERTAKGTKGGFSVGGFDTKDEGQKYLFADPLGVNVYIDDIDKKTSKGGFSVGGFDTKGNKFMDVKYESTKILTGDSDQGFGVGSLTTGLTGNYLKLTPENYFIGHNSGLNTVPTATTGKYNSFLGFRSGFTNVSGGYNVFMGFESGKANTTGDQNIFIGFQSGLANEGGQRNVFLGTYSGQANVSGTANVFIGGHSGYSNKSSGNVFVGDQAGEYNETGFRNVFLGAQSGMDNFDGTFNTFIGFSSGESNESGFSNVALGFSSGYNNKDGEDNVYLGAESGTANVSGDNNVYIGYQSGDSNKGSRNIFIGYQAGHGESTADDRLYIENSNKDSNNSLIYGEFNTDLIRLNATVKIRDVLNLIPRATAPSPASEGDIYYDSSTHKLRVYTDTGWQDCNL